MGCGNLKDGLLESLDPMPESGPRRKQIVSFHNRIRCFTNYLHFLQSLRGIETINTLNIDIMMIGVRCTSTFFVAFFALMSFSFLLSLSVAGVCAFLPSLSTQTRSTTTKKMAADLNSFSLAAESVPWDRTDLMSRAVEVGLLTPKTGDVASILSTASSQSVLETMDTTTLLIAGVIVTVLAIGIATVTSGGGTETSDSNTSTVVTKSKEAEAKSVDLSIPYTAAAKLVYDRDGYTVDFATFEDLYVKQSIALVIAKKVKRDAEQSIGFAEKEAEAAAAALLALPRKQ